MNPEHRISAVRRLRHGRQRGFTLVELVIVMLVAAILTAIAVPMYLNQVRESRRTDARSALLDLAGREERYFATNSAYTASSVTLGYTTTAQGNVWPQTVGSGYYQIGAPNVAAGPPPSYSITATPIGTQTADTACASLTVTSTGAETSTGTGSASTCWGQ